MTGAAGYSSSDNKIPNFDEILNGLVTRSDTLESTTSGPAQAKRVSVNADGPRLCRDDQVASRICSRFDNWRVPGMSATYETDLFGAAGTGGWVGSPFSLSTRLRRRRRPRSRAVPGAYPPALPHEQFRSRRNQRAAATISGQDLKSNKLDDTVSRTLDRAVPLHGSFDLAVQRDLRYGRDVFPGEARARRWPTIFWPRARRLRPGGNRLAGGLRAQSGWLGYGRLFNESGARGGQQHGLRGHQHRRDRAVCRLHRPAGGRAEHHGRFCFRL